MPYATVFDVEAYTTARAPFTANTKPSATQVGGHVAAACADIDAALLLAGYDIPVPSTATQAFEFVRDACAVCAAVRVERAAPTSDRIDHFKEMCESAKKMIAEGQLPGLDKTGNDGDVRFEPSVATLPLFTRDMNL